MKQKNERKSKHNKSKSHQVKEIFIAVVKNMKLLNQTIIRCLLNLIIVLDIVEKIFSHIQTYTYI